MRALRTLIAVGLGAVALAATLTVPASAAPAARERVVIGGGLCTYPPFGGRYYCKYEEEFLQFSDGTVQIFVIGTDYSVWTSWIRGSGPASAWVSLGGQIHHSGDANDLEVCALPLRSLPTVNIRGTDNGWWDRTRQNNGAWTAWARRGPLCSV